MTKAKEFCWAEERMVLCMQQETRQLKCGWQLRRSLKNTLSKFMRDIKARVQLVPVLMIIVLEECVKAVFEVILHHVVN